MSLLFDQTPLNPSEKSYLQTIYDTRMRLFLLIYLTLSPIAFLLPFSGKGVKVKDTYYRTRSGNWVKHDAFEYEIFGHDMTDTELYWSIIIPYELIMIGTGSYIFLKKINPYRKDILSGNKEMTPRTIASKSYFPMTNQYFFNFDDPDLMHYEVDAELYWGMNDGDTILIPRAIYSKQVFEKNGRFTIM